MSRDELLLTVYNKYINAITTKTGNWKDYNDVYQYYLQLIDLKNTGLLPGVEIPPEPQPSDFS